MAKPPKTLPEARDVGAFIDAVEDPRRREDSRVVLEMMRAATGCEPVMWGPGIVGFDRYHYRYDSGQDGEWPIVGFSPRKQALVLYVMPGFSGYDALLAKLMMEQVNAAAEPSRRRPKTPGKRPTMSNTDKDSIKAAILKLKTDRFSFDELRAQVSGDYESLKAALFELLEEPSPVVRQVFDKKAKAMHLVRVRP